MKVKVKRVYDAPERDDGYRVLVDRLWPRGLTKDKAKVDLWLKGVAPSEELREWFGHDPERYEEFRRHYFEELEGEPEQVAALLACVKRQPVTLLYGARDAKLNNAVALLQYIEDKLARETSRRAA